MADDAEAKLQRLPYRGIVLVGMGGHRLRGHGALRMIGSRRAAHREEKPEAAGVSATAPTPSSSADLQSTLFWRLVPTPHLFPQLENAWAEVHHRRS